MGLRHLQLLKLDIEQVLRTIDFLEACANTAKAQLVQPRDGTPSRVDRATTTQEAWASRIDAACALREAAQWAAFVDPPRARSLLADSAELFLEQRYGFGIFLMAVTGRWLSDPPLREISSFIDQVLAAQSPSAEPTGIPAALRHPQQQAYVLLAAAGMPTVAETNRDALDTLARRSRYRLGVVPVGALGTPIRHFWDIALHLLIGDPQSGLPVVLEHLESMSRSYAESIDLAMTNGYLWSHGAAPVDVADLDILGITALALTRFGRQTMGNAMELMVERLNPLTRISMELGMEITDEPTA